MTRLRNIFACLIHERPECVVDLIRNLHALDPDSLILLYNGGTPTELLDSHFPLERYGAVLHPAPHPAQWGHLHPFALECMEWAIENHPFDTLTIVDSDQLATRPGYSEALAHHLKTAPGRLGLLGNSSSIQPPNTKVGPARAAYAETELWRPFLREFPQGESRWVHWTFWPSTIFLDDAARDLTRLYATNHNLQKALQHSRIWASEEVLLPTLVSLLGYDIGVSPFSYDYVQYRIPYSSQQVVTALQRDDVFWMHPVPRSYEDPIRKTIREKFHHYAPESGPIEPSTPPRFLLTLSILERMRSIEGWLEDAEADLLIGAVTHAIKELPNAPGIVEIGSYCGKSTVVLASVLAAISGQSGAKAVPKISAIDPHDGLLGAADRGLLHVPPTLEKLRNNLTRSGLAEFVDIIPSHSTQVTWDQPISFLLIDGLHDYNSVSHDFYHFESSLVAGALIAFHDYADYFPGVIVFVDELLAGDRYEKVHRAGSLVLLRKREALARQAPLPAALRPPLGSQTTALQPIPDAPTVIAHPLLVSCLMPTADRRGLVPQAIEYFLRQDYSHRELIIIDDGADDISALVPSDPRFRYVRLDRRHTLGAKHNLGCEMARGDVILHWDDDDWMADWRISYQLRSLDSQPVDTLSGLARLLFWDPRSQGSWEYVYPASDRPWVAGGTFCYRRRFWESHRFPEMNEGVDTVFVWGLVDARVLALPNADFYVATIHPQNTSRKRTQTAGWKPVPRQRIHALVRDDLAFYEAWAGVPLLLDR